MKIVLCAGMPRAASKLVFQATQRIVSFCGYPIETSLVVPPPVHKSEIPYSKELYRIGTLHPYAKEYMDTHSPLAITSYRDPRGVVASYRRLFHLGIDKEIAQLRRDIAYVFAYARYGALLLRYEYFTQDVVEMVQTISNYLFGVRLDSGAAHGIADECSTDKVIAYHYTKIYRYTGSVWQTDLSPEEIVAVEEASMEYMNQFSYE